MWEISINGQLLTCLYSVILGILLSFLYDIINSLFKVLSHSRILLFFGDILFWIINAFAVFIFLIARTNGEIRGYVILSVFSGFLLYRATVHRFVYPAFYKVFKFSASLCRKISGGIRSFCGVCERFSGKITDKAAKTCLKVRNGAKKVLKSMFKMLYTDKNKKESGAGADE